MRRDPKPAKTALTARQQQCLAYASFGATAKEIARALGLSPETVREHLEEAYRRLGANCRGQALARARENGLAPQVTPPRWGEESRSFLGLNGTSPQSGGVSQGGATAMRTLDDNEVGAVSGGFATMTLDCLYIPVPDDMPGFWTGPAIVDPISPCVVAPDSGPEPITEGPCPPPPGDDYV